MGRWSYVRLALSQSYLCVYLWEEHAIEIVGKDERQKGTLQNITKYVSIDKKLSKITKIEIKHIL